MAEIALGAANIVLTKAIDILGNLGVEDGVRLYWLKQDIYWIERQMRFLQSLLKDADAMHEQNYVATNLMNDIRDLAYDVEDIMDTYMPALATRERKGFLSWLLSSINNIFCDSSARDFVMEVQAIRRRVDEINSARNLLNVTQSVPGNKLNVGGFAWRKNERTFVGFEERIKDLTLKLRDEDVISIVAMGGTGKTTLAEELFRLATLMKEDDSSTLHFKCSAKVVVSQEPNVKELLQDIARQVGLAKDKWEEKVEVNLLEYLTGKRYVILFDDIWHTQTWDNLYKSIPKNSENGSKIIITSRQKSVGLHIGGESSLHELPPLNPDDSRKLFYEMVTESPDTDLSQELRDLGDQIVERCGGVPLSIVVTAGLLSIREKTVHAWKRVLDRMGQDKDVSKILALSYQDLDFELKPCFLYFGLFPEDYEVSIFQLINLWVAEGFINLNRERAPEDIGEDYLAELIDRNLIQVCRRRFNGRIKSCRIHDLLHNLCISLAKKSNFFNTLSDVTSTPAMSVRRVTTYGDSITSFKYQTPKLRALFSFCREFLILESKHLGDFRFLRVLCVECKRISLSLPNEIGNLSQLGYLRLWGFGLRKLPSTLSNLKNLLTLDVEGLYFLLFDDVIWKMKQLRHIIFPKVRFSEPASHILLFRDKITRCKANMHWFCSVETCLPNPQTLLHMDGFNLKSHWLRKFTN
ncbi:hypothetical protein F0562_029993 [Nyssa sinensis]|uniref:NB-ARC domain-containing protein n=1 Tax=Nyssa sinensis TaxID=561372 RepID=A0A5J5AXF7_9ASTE|nr:hypothetical protein F0562_029993 [Nyssa sinensis]